MKITPKLCHFQQQLSKNTKNQILIELDHFRGSAASAIFDEIFFVFRLGFHVERIAFSVHATQDQLVVLLDRPFGRALGKNVKYFRHKFCEEAWAWICDGAIAVVDKTFPHHDTVDV